MPYKLPGGSQLTSADEEVHYIIKDLVHRKNAYIEYHGTGCVGGAAYSRTVHGLDLLQYLVLEEGHSGRLHPRFQMDELLGEFEEAKKILDNGTINLIQHCIDVLEGYVQTFEVAAAIKKHCK